MTDPIAAHLAAVRRDRYSDATRTARRRKTFTGASKAEVRNRMPRMPGPEVRLCASRSHEPSRRTTRAHPARWPASGIPCAIPGISLLTSIQRRP